MVMYRQREDLEFFGTVARDEYGRLLLTEYGGTATNSKANNVSDSPSPSKPPSDQNAIYTTNQGENTNQGLTRTRSSVTIGVSDVQRINGALNPWNAEVEEHSKQYYDLVRSMSTDCVKISENTGVPQSIVENAKQHLFMNKHDLGWSEKEFFFPDYEIAQSWQRMSLNKNTVQAHCIILLYHENLECYYMSLGDSQQIAHDKANKKFNYANALEDRE